MREVARGSTKPLILLCARFVRAVRARLREVRCDPQNFCARGSREVVRAGPPYPPMRFAGACRAPRERKEKGSAKGSFREGGPLIAKPGQQRDNTTKNTLAGPWLRVKTTWGRRSAIAPQL
jgi:hypothetical protein